MGFIYLPSQERQIKPSDPFGKYNCGCVATAVAIDRATIGGVMVNGEDVRARTNEPHPDPGSPGTTIKQLVDSAAHWNVDLSEVKGGRAAAILVRLDEGRGVVLAGTGEALGQYICQAGFRGPHAIYLNNRSSDKTKVVTYNPLCPIRYYLPTALVLAYAEAYGALTGRINWAFTRVTPNIVTQIN